MSLERPATVTLPSDVLIVLGQFRPETPAADWTGHALGQGEQGRAYVVARRDGQPVHGGAASLVVKLFDERKAWARDAALDQFDVLTLLARTINGTTSGDWTVGCPAAQHWCERPLAIVMTRVPGRPLGTLLAEGNAGVQDVDAIAGALAAALDHFWSEGGRVYGEVNLDNVLCDPATRSLWFIDPGIARPARLCVDDRGPWYPASHDLAYLLYAGASGAVRAGAFRPGVRARQMEMTIGILREACQRLAPGAEDATLPDEIAAIARVHLGHIRTSWRPFGVWRHLVRRDAARGIARVIDGLRPPAQDPALVSVRDELPALRH